METETVQMQPDKTGFNDLKNQLLDRRDSGKTKPTQEKADKFAAYAEQSTGKEEERQPEVEAPQTKKYVFRKGDQTYELDEDAELEMTADKKPVKLTLRELKDRAAGDIAVKNRMHALAEEKKKVQATLKEFATLSKKDPLGALEYISQMAKDADSEFEYKKYLSALAEQAEKLGSMDEQERKAYELEKKLTKVEQDLSLKEREAAVVRRKQELLSEFPEVGDQQFGQMVEAVLNNEELSGGIEDENDLMDVVEDLVRETLTQRDIIKVIQDINPAYARDNALIFSISDQLKQNPDLDEEDVRDIISQVIGPSERERASRTLSQKQRGAVPVSHLRAQGANDFELLKMQLLERKESEKFSKR